MTARPKSPLDQTPAPPSEQPTYGFGRQTRGSRKGLGGDPPNAPVHRQRPRRTGEVTPAQAPDRDQEDHRQK